MYYIYYLCTTKQYWNDPILTSRSLYISTTISHQYGLDGIRSTCNHQSLHLLNHSIPNPSSTSSVLPPILISVHSIVSSRSIIGANMGLGWNLDLVDLAIHQFGLNVNIVGMNNHNGLVRSHLYVLMQPYYYQLLGSHWSCPLF